VHIFNRSFNFAVRRLLIVRFHSLFSELISEQKTSND